MAKPSKAERKKEIARKNKEANRIRQNLIKANSCNDPIATPLLSAFTTFSIDIPKSTSSAEAETNKVSLKISFFKSPLPPVLLNVCMDLFEANMGALYEASQWGLNLDEKRDELTHEGAQFLIVTIDTNQDGTDGWNKDSLVAFTHFRFEVNDDDHPTEEVLYLWEIQVQDAYRRYGLGKRLMTIMEVIGMQMKMKKVMLTVFKNNQPALEFYRKKLKYGIDESSPTNYESGPDDEEADYEILSKCVNKRDKI